MDISEEARDSADVVVLLRRSLGGLLISGGTRRPRLMY